MDVNVRGILNQFAGLLVTVMVSRITPYPFALFALSKSSLFTPVAAQNISIPRSQFLGGAGCMLAGPQDQGPRRAEHGSLPQI